MQKLGTYPISRHVPDDLIQGPVVSEAELGSILPALPFGVAPGVRLLPAEIWLTPRAKVSRRMFGVSLVDMIMPV